MSSPEQDFQDFSRFSGLGVFVNVIFSIVRGSASVSRQKPSIHRSAGACPPRSSDLHEKRPMSRGRGRFL